MVLVAMALAVTYYIIARGIFNQTIIFAEEFSGYGVVLIVFLGLAYTLRTKGHISVEVVVRYLPPRVRLVMEAINTLIALGAVALLMQTSSRWVERSLEMKVRSFYPSQMAMWPLHLIIPIGLGLFALELFLHFLRTTQAVVKGAEGKEAP